MNNILSYKEFLNKEKSVYEFASFASIAAAKGASTMAVLKNLMGRQTILGITGLAIVSASSLVLLYLEILKSKYDAKALLDKEKNPEKRFKLEQEIANYSSEEIKLRNKIEDEKIKMEKHFNSLDDEQKIALYTDDKFKKDLYKIRGMEEKLKSIRSFRGLDTEI